MNLEAMSGRDPFQEVQLPILEPGMIRNQLPEHRSKRYAEAGEAFFSVPAGRDDSHHHRALELPCFQALGRSLGPRTRPGHEDNLRGNVTESFLSLFPQERGLAETRYNSVTTSHHL